MFNDEPDRIARAIWDSRHSYPWNQASTSQRLKYRRVAEIAIAAMGEFRMDIILKSKKSLEQAAQQMLRMQQQINALEAQLNERI